MRINCAKCGHLHDSTVTPFMHDIIKATPVPTDPEIHSRMSIGRFKCEKCGSENFAALTWTVVEK